MIDSEVLPNKAIKKPLEEIDITLEMIKSKLDKLKIDKSAGADQLYPRVLYEAREEVAVPLLMIYKKSISSGRLPDDWKIADVIALYKKGSRSELGNYRPVSLTSICCKIMESLLRPHGHGRERIFLDQSYKCLWVFTWDFAAI